jgi:hypothetical protein
MIPILSGRGKLLRLSDLVLVLYDLHYLRGCFVTNHFLNPIPIFEPATKALVYFGSFSKGTALVELLEVFIVLVKPSQYQMNCEGLRRAIPDSSVIDEGSLRYIDFQESDPHFHLITS